MPLKILGSIAFAVAAFTGSVAALAANETLTFASDPFTSAYDASSSSPPVAVGSGFGATLTLSSPLGDNFSGNAAGNVTSLVFTTKDGSTTNTLSLTAGQAAGSSFYFTTNSSGAITGWNFTAGLLSPSAASSDIIFHSCFNDGCAAGTYNGQGYGVTGDWYDYHPGSSTAADGCTYSLPTNCGGSGSGTVGGTWAVAPELSASSAGTGLTLLVGGLAVLLGRRRGAWATAA
jgi:hypothetical protein